MRIRGIFSQRDTYTCTACTPTNTTVPARMQAPDRAAQLAQVAAALSGNTPLAPHEILFTTTADRTWMLEQFVGASHCELIPHGMRLQVCVRVCVRARVCVKLCARASDVHAIAHDASIDFPLLTPLNPIHPAIQGVPTSTRTTACDCLPLHVPATIIPMIAEARGLPPP